MRPRINFVVQNVGSGPSATPNTFTLVRDNWDDFRFKTMYVLHYTNRKRESVEIGALKIGEFDLGNRGGSPTLPASFMALGAGQFSLGQEREYYERLRDLDGELGQMVLAALNDIALDENLFERALEEQVTTVSLFRNITSGTVLGQFRRIAWGGAALTSYDFRYLYPERDGGEQTELEFQIEPGSMPPSNIHVLIGSNGAGKTTLLRNMRASLLGSDSGDGGFYDPDPEAEGVPFVNLVTVTFSAFDPFSPAEDGQSDSATLKNHYIGLKSGYAEETTKTNHDLANDFLDSIKYCWQGARRTRWQHAVDILCSDPLLADSNIVAALDTASALVSDEEILEAFSVLSSGHKIVLLTATKLVQTVEEKTLILLDEPEAHLHPPLLSAFIRAVSELLEDRNGVAILATHSPVILQEVPKDCVYRISRVGNLIKAERLGVETFGEDVGTLTSAVFGLEVTKTGFHRLLLKALSESDGSYRGALRLFDRQLGGEARAILRSRSSSDGGH